MRRTFLVSFALALLTASSAHAAEICGNGIDDDADGLEDEGCYPTLTTGQCESPLSCDVMVARVILHIAVWRYS